MLIYHFFRLSNKPYYQIYLNNELIQKPTMKPPLEFLRYYIQNIFISSEEEGLVTFIVSNKKAIMNDEEWNHNISHNEFYDITKNEQIKFKNNNEFISSIYITETHFIVR